MRSQFKALNSAFEIIKQTDLKIYIYCEILCYCIFYKNKCYSCNETIFNKNELINFLLKFQIQLIYIINNKSVAIHYHILNNAFFNYNNIIYYNYFTPRVLIIQQAWKKYRLRNARIRNDLVIHGLAEYFYHPSRMVF
jgi:hypothetical protein